MITTERRERLHGSLGQNWVSFVEEFFRLDPQFVNSVFDAPPPALSEAKGKLRPTQDRTSKHG